MIELGIIYSYSNMYILAEKYLKLLLNLTSDSEASYFLDCIYEKQYNFGLAIKYFLESEIPEASERISAIEYKVKLLNI